MIVAQSIADNECFKWCLIRYLNPVDHNPRRFTKADKDFAKRLDFKDIKFPVKIIDIHKMKRKNSIDISVFGYENKGKCPIYVSKECEEKHVDLLLIGEGKKNMFLSNISIDSCMIIHYIVEEIFLLLFTVSITEEILKHHIIKAYKQMIKVSKKKANMLNSKILKEI